MSEKFHPLSTEQMDALEAGAALGGGNGSGSSPVTRARAGGRGSSGSSSSSSSSSSRRYMDLVSGALSFGRVAAVCEDVLAQHGALASPGLVELAASFYLQLLRELPALVRDWWSHKLPCPCMQTLITAPWPPHRCAIGGPISSPPGASGHRWPSSQRPTAHPNCSERRLTEL